MYNVDGYEEMYGDLYEKQLALELGYKRMAEWATTKAYEATEQMDSSVEASSTTAGIKFIACQWQEAFEGMKLFVEDCLRPKKVVELLMCCLCRRLQRFTRIRLMTWLACSLLQPFTTLFNNILKKEIAIVLLHKTSTKSYGVKYVPKHTWIM